MWSIAVKTLIADRGKLFTALVGVCFSVILVNIQGGLFLGLIRRAGMLVDHGQADIWVGHRKMYNIDFPRDIPRRWLYRIEGLPGIARAEPYMVGVSEMTLPSGGFESVVVVGVEEASLLGNTWNIRAGRAEDVLRTDGIIVDELEAEKLDYPEIGELREIGNLRARVVAKSRGVMGFLVLPYVFTTYNRAAQFLRKRPDVCSYFLVQVEPGADPQTVCTAIRQRIPDVEAYTREQYSTISVNFWMHRTGLGISFGAATLLGVLVGLVMVAETLYALVLDRLSEFGTLKAIGAQEYQIFAILISHAVIMGLLGSIIGTWSVSAIQYYFSTPRAPILIPLWLSLGSCGLVLCICLVSVVLPYLRIRKVDPLLVLQGG
ncbi:MAG: ABC transporter permease [Pirellulaceae bacterium]